MNTKTKILYGGLRALDRELASEEWDDAKYTILVDENTFQHCLPRLVDEVEALQEAMFVEVPVGEECKSLEVAEQVWQTLLEGEADRDTVIVNLGGGCVSDLGGYVASGYKRGIRYINVPTSLLAMADASVGGKTAINYGGVKNSIGYFYSPVLTVIEPAFLDTLPTEEHLCGLLEVVKTAAVASPSLFRQLLSTDGCPTYAIKEAVRIKNRVVRTDPYDQGVRRILNLGHTFGHAIEVYHSLPHGIAVGIGMSVAMYLSTKKIGLADEVYSSYSQWLEKQFAAQGIQPSAFTLKDIEAMLPLLRQDKKNAQGAIRCVLLQDLGAAMIDVEVSDNEIRDAMLHIAKGYQL